MIYPVHCARILEILYLCQSHIQISGIVRSIQMMYTYREGRKVHQLVLQRGCPEAPSCWLQFDTSVYRRASACCAAMTASHVWVAACQTSLSGLAMLASSCSSAARTHESCAICCASCRAASGSSGKPAGRSWPSLHDKSGLMPTVSMSRNKGVLYLQHEQGSEWSGMAMSSFAQVFRKEAPVILQERRNTHNTKLS